MAQTRQMRRPLFEAPAPVCVCGLLVVAALTKGGHFHWAIGGMISAYLLYLAVQYAKHGASRARALGVAHSIMMKHSDIHRRSDDDGYDCRSDSPDVRSGCSGFTPRAFYPSQSRTAHAQCHQRRSKRCLLEEDDRPGFPPPDGYLICPKKD